MFVRFVSRADWDAAASGISFLVVLRLQLKPRLMFELLKTDLSSKARRCGCLASFFNHPVKTAGALAPPASSKKIFLLLGVKLPLLVTHTVLAPMKFVV